MTSNTEDIPYVSPRWVSVTDTAKLIRVRLKNQFPGVKFSVRSDKYSGGASIHISWVDGPRESDVDAVVGVFEGGRFDGMIDLAYSVRSFLHDDGTATLAHDPGTTGSCPERFGDPADGSAQLVRFGANFVFTNRKISDEFAESCENVAAVLPAGDLGGKWCDSGYCHNKIGDGDGFYVSRERGGHAAACSRLCAGKLAAPSVSAA